MIMTQQEKSQGIIKVSQPLGTMDICTAFHGNRRDTSVRSTVVDGSPDIAVPRAMLTAWLESVNTTITCIHPALRLGDN